MARVVAAVPDLLFGSKVQALLAAGGHSVELVADEAAVRDRLDAGADVLVVDLTTDRLDGAALLEALRGDGSLGAVRTLAFYSHVEAETRERAVAAGFDEVVPRSRMNREGAALVDRLVAG